MLCVFTENKMRTFIAALVVDMLCFQSLSYLMFLQI
jgi:hypothetical protein